MLKYMYSNVNTRFKYTQLGKLHCRITVLILEQSLAAQSKQVRGYLPWYQTEAATFHSADINHTRWYLHLGVRETENSRCSIGKYANFRRPHHGDCVTYADH